MKQNKDKELANSLVLTSDWLRENFWHAFISCQLMLFQSITEQLCFQCKSSLTIGHVVKVCSNFVSLDLNTLEKIYIKTITSVVPRRHLVLVLDTGKDSLRFLVTRSHELF